MNTRTPLARRVIAGLLMVPLTACLSWQPTTVSPQQWTSEERPSSVRVTQRSGETITLKDPTMRNDSIAGIIQDDPTGYRRSVAVSDVSTVEVRRIDTVMTIFFGVFVPVLTYGYFAASGFSNSSW